MHADRFRLLVVLIFLCNLSLSALTAEPARRETKLKTQNSELKTNSDAGVVFTSLSPFAALHDVPVQAVTLGEGVWKMRFRTNVERSIPSFFGLLEKARALDKLRGRKNKARGNSDADLAKWMEAASFVLQSQENRQLHNLLQRVISDISISAEQGGYLQDRYMNAMPTDLANLKTSGQLYCLGHLLQAAIAYYRATGSEQLLNLFVPYIDGVIDRFGPGKQLCWSGHPEIEMALVELYRTTGEKKYLSFAHYLLEQVDLRRMEKAREVDFHHYFVGLPFTSRKELSGHAVCTLYACCGATDYYIETGDQEIWRTVLTLWHDLTQYKMYVTGGVGS